MSFGETNIQNEWLISKIVEVTEINSYLREERSNWILEYDNLMSRFKQTISYVSEVEEKAQNLSKDNEMLSSELKGSNLKLEQATRTITELQGLLDSRSGQDDLFKMQQEQISARESELKAKVEELTLKYANALKDSHSESESHAETVKNLEQKIKDLEKTEGLISEKLDVIAQEKIGTEAKAADLESLTEALTERLRESEIKHAEEVNSLKKELATVDREIRSRKNSEQEILTENSTLASKLELLEEQLNDSKIRVQQLELEKEYQKSEEERLSIALDQEKQAAEKKQRENADLEEQIQKLMTEVKQLQDQNLRLEEDNILLQQNVEKTSQNLDESSNLQKSQLEDLQKEIEIQQSLKSKIELLESTIESLHCERTKAAEMSDNLALQLEAAKKTLDERKQAFDESQAEITKLNDSNSRLQESVESLTSEVQELQTSLENSVSSAEYNSLKLIIEEKEIQLAEKELELKAASDKLKNLASDNTIKTESILLLEARVVELEEQVSAGFAQQQQSQMNENLKTELENEKQILEAKIQSLQQAYSEAEQEIAENVEELKFLRSAKQMLELRINELQHANNEKSQSDYKIEELNQQISSLTTQMERIRQDNSREVQEISEEKSTLQEKLISLEHEHQLKLTELEELKQSQSNYDPQLQEEEKKELELLKQVKEELASKIETLEQENQSQSLESDRVTQEIAELYQHKIDLENQITELGQANLILQESVERLNSQIRDLQEELSAAQTSSANQDLHDQIVQLNSENEELRSQISNLGIQNSDLETMISSLRDQNALLGQRVEQLQGRMDQMTEDNLKLFEMAKSSSGNELDATNDQTILKNVAQNPAVNLNLAQDEDLEYSQNLLTHIPDPNTAAFGNQSKADLIARIESLGNELENAYERIKLLETKVESLQNPSSGQFGFQRQETSQSETTEFLTESKNRVQVEELKEKIKLLEYQIEEYQNRLNTSEHKISTFVSRERELNREIFESEQREEAIQNALRENKLKMKQLEEKMQKDDLMNQELRDKFSEIVKSNNGLSENPSFSDISYARTKSEAPQDHLTIPSHQDESNHSKSQMSADLLTKSVDLNSPSRKTLLRNDTEKDMISELSMMEIQAKKDQHRYNNIQNYIDELKIKLAEVENLRLRESKKNQDLQKNLKALEELNTEIQKSNLQAERDREELTIKLAKIEEEKQSQVGPHSNRTLETFGMRSEKEADHGSRTDRSRSDYGDVPGFNKHSSLKIGQEPSSETIQREFDSLKAQHTNLKRENYELKEILQENSRQVKELKNQLHQRGLNESNLLTLSRSVQNNQVKGLQEPHDESLYTLIESIKHNGMTKNAEAELVNLLEENKSLKSMMENSKMDDTSFDGEFGLRLRKKDDIQEAVQHRNNSDYVAANSEKLNSRIKELEKELLTRIDEITKLVERNEKLHRDLDNLERENSKFRRMLDDKDRTINNLQDSYSKILNDNKSRDNSSTENERAQTAYLQKMIDLYEDQKHTDKEWIEKLRGELEKERSRALNMESLYLDSKDRIETLSKEMIDMKEREKQLLIKMNRFELLQANNEIGGPDGNRANSDLVKEIGSLKLQNQKQKGEIETLLKSHNNLEKLVSRKYSKSPTHMTGMTDTGSKSPFRARYGQNMNDSDFKHSPLDTGILNTSSNTANSIKEDYKNAQSSVEAVRRKIKEISDNHFDDAVYSDGLSSAQKNQSLQKQLHQAERVLLTLSSKMKNLEEKLVLYIRRAEQDSKKSMGSSGYQIRDSSLGQTLNRAQNFSKSPITSEKKNHAFERTHGARSDLTPNDQGIRYDEKQDAQEDKNGTGYLDLQSRLTPDEKSALATRFSNTMGHVGVKDLIETDFIASLKVVLGNICILKQRYGDLKYSYQMIDERVGKMIVFMQKKNPKAIVISQLEEFVNCSVLVSIANNIERLNDLENSTHAKIMKELNKLFMKLKKEVEEIKKMIEIRKICLSSIMNRNNFFINDMKIQLTQSALF